MTEVRIRYSVRQLQEMYDQGNTEPLDHLVDAWRQIKALPHDDPRSFFTIGGFHGEPFQYRTDPSNFYWGGYCNHANVLFPTWHRAYVLRLEQALQSIHPDVMMPYWDETSEESLTHGIPHILTDDTYTMTVASVTEQFPNPLKSFVLPVGLDDHLDAPGDTTNLYTKPAGYETVRYPLSGLVGTPEDLAKTQAHNAQYPDYDTNVNLLNQNIVAWLNGTQGMKKNISQLFQQCLDAPDYTLFSNTTSAGAVKSGNIVPLESPHNYVHLAVGGFDIGQNLGLVSGSNGDMGENDTAGLDPIFFFHHCNVDRMFWVWQKKNGFTESFDITQGDPGAEVNYGNGQGPTPTQGWDEKFTMQTPLTPFRKDNNDFFNSQDVINVHNLGYDYSIGSLDQDNWDHQIVKDIEVATPRFSLHVEINRLEIRGSFLVEVFAPDGALIGTEAVLSRASPKLCENCVQHPYSSFYFRLDEQYEGVPAEDFRVEIRTRDFHTGDIEVKKEVVSA